MMLPPAHHGEHWTYRARVASAFCVLAFATFLPSAGAQYYSPAERDYYPSPAFVAPAPSVPLRGTLPPGSVCNYWSPRTGECMDFSFYDYGASVLPAPVVPVPYPIRQVYPAVRRGSRGTRRYAYDRYGGVTVRVTGFPGVVLPGETITYSIYLRNDTPYGEDVGVDADLDPDTSLTHTSERGRERRRGLVEWDRIYVPPRGSETLTLKARVSGGVRDGDRLRIRVSADGDEDETTTDVETYRRDRRRRYRCDDDAYSYGRYDRRYRYDNSSYNDRSRSRSRYDDWYDRDAGHSRSRRDWYWYDDCEDDDRRYGSVRISATDSPDPVDAGELLTYSIDIWNDESRGRYVGLRAILDRSTTFFSASDRGVNRGRGEVEWDSIYVDASSSRRIVLTVRVDTPARYDDLLRLLLTSEGDSFEVTTRVRDRYRY